MEKRLTLDEFVLFISLRQIIISSFNIRPSSSHLFFSAKGYLPVFELGVAIHIEGIYDGTYVDFKYFADLRDIRLLPSQNVFPSLLDTLNRFNPQKRSTNSNDNV